MSKSSPWTRKQEEEFVKATARALYSISVLVFYLVLLLTFITKNAEFLATLNWFMRGGFLVGAASLCFKILSENPFK